MADLDIELKVEAKYPPYRQRNIIMRALLSGDFTDLKEMDRYISECTGKPATQGEVENTERLEKLEAKLKATQEALEARPETVMPEFEPETEQESYDEPPAEIADLIDPELTARQNLDALTAKFAAAKNLEEYCRSNDDMEGAMKHLRDAERFESGIKWNRAVLAEVV